MPRKSDATIGRLSTMTPAELPPMASSRGIFDAASFSAARILPRWYAGIGLLDRLPHDLFAEDRLAVDDGRHLQVRRAEIEPDAAAVQMAAERLAPSRAAGTSSASQTTTVNGRPWTCSPMKKWSNARAPSAA